MEFKTLKPIYWNTEYNKDLALINTNKNPAKKTSHNFTLLNERLNKANKDFNFNDWRLLNVKKAVKNRLISLNAKLENLDLYTEDKNGVKLRCICGQRIKKGFPVYNPSQGIESFAFIGSACIYHFKNFYINKAIEKYNRKLRERNVEAKKRFREELNLEKKRLKEEAEKQAYEEERAHSELKRKQEEEQAEKWKAYCEQLEKEAKARAKKAREEEINDMLEKMKLTGEITVKLGKHKGKTVRFLYKNNLDYMNWCIKTFDDNSYIKKKFELYLKLHKAFVEERDKRKKSKEEKRKREEREKLEEESN